jgi:hypothetical protein
MYTGRTVFSQIMEFLPQRDFRNCVTRYRGHYKVKKFSCQEQYRCMAFAQLTYRQSLRDIEVCLRAIGSRLYHMGIRSKVSRSTLADANEKRDWRIYADFAQGLIATARQLYAKEDLGIDLEGTVYALDSTTIDLCLSMFPWARFRQYKGAIKLHTLLNLRGNIPEFIHISDGKLHDVNVLDLLIPEPGSFYVMDRGYVDYSRLYVINQVPAYFVTRTKSNMNFQRRYSHRAYKEMGILCDQTITLLGYYAAMDYPEPLRRIRYYDDQTDMTLTFLTNNFILPAQTIAALYRARWQVELFFKWIKQHLRIKKFYGTSENAVKTQIWIAVSVYVLVAILRKRLRIDLSLYTILQILSVTLFEKSPIIQILTESGYSLQQRVSPNQLGLF